MIALLRRWLLGDPTTCRCGHSSEAHTHWRPGGDCGACGCPRFRRNRRATQPLNLADVCRDEALVAALGRNDLATARGLTQPEFVDYLTSPEFTHALLTSWANNGGQAGRRTA